jgi:hypothetical protein
MWIISKLLENKKELGISTEQTKAKIYECLREGQPPEKVMADQRLEGWELLKSKRDALLYIKYIHRRVESEGDQGSSQCCGKFTNLSDNQTYQQEHFIENHTLV